MRLATFLAVMVWAVAGVAQDEERPLRMKKPLVLTEGWGTVEGQFVLDGDVPPPPLPLVRNPAPGVPDVPDERLLIDPETKGIANLVVYLRKAPAAVHPELQRSKAGVVEFKAEDFRFKPHLLHVRTDQKVKCIAADGRVDNVNVSPFSNNGVNFMIGGEHGDVEITMDRPEAIPIMVKSDGHLWMQVYWIVTDHPYVAISDDLGRFRIEGLPPGAHSFALWHERVGFIDRKWTVEVRSKELLTLPAVKVSASRFQPG